MGTEKAMTLRLTVEQYEELRVLARVSGRSVAEEIREAVSEWVAARKADAAFAARARTMAAEWASFAESCAV